MERLTRKSEKGDYTTMGFIYMNKDTDCYKAVQRLADYEDIGTVEEFLQLKTKQDIIHSLKNQDGKCDMSVSGETFEFMLYGLMEALRVNEADNFLALTLGNDKNKYSVVIQKCDGKTPAEMLAEKSIEIEKLTTQLENSVQLPCKVGDTVYWIYSKGATGWYNDIRVCKVSSISISEHYIEIHSERTSLNDTNFWGRIGDNVFLTKEAAEARLEELQKED